MKLCMHFKQLDLLSKIISFKKINDLLLLFGLIYLYILSYKYSFKMENEQNPFPT